MQETILRTENKSPTRDLINRYLGLQKGQSYNKSPDGNGAFPTAPYSHTPKGQRAKQPGMTGMVKEEILIRQAELGVYIENGQLGFDFLLFDRYEFLYETSKFDYWSVNGEMQQKADSLVYTVCQVPVIVQSSNLDNITVYRTDGNTQQIEGQHPGRDKRHPHLPTKRINPPSGCFCFTE